MDNYAHHVTEGMTDAEKKARCRQWVPGGKFRSEPGSLYDPDHHTQWWYWCHRRPRYDKIWQLKAVP